MIKLGACGTSWHVFGTREMKVPPFILVGYCWHAFSGVTLNFGYIRMHWRPSYT